MDVTKWIARVDKKLISQTKIKNNFVFLNYKKFYIPWMNISIIVSIITINGLLCTFIWSYKSTKQVLINLLCRFSFAIWDDNVPVRFNPVKYQNRQMKSEKVIEYWIPRISRTQILFATCSTNIIYFYSSLWYIQHRIVYIKPSDE